MPVYETVVCDVTVEDDVATLTTAAVERFGRIDAMFNVAGGNHGALLVDMTEADWDHTVDLCLGYSSGSNTLRTR